MCIRIQEQKQTYGACNFERPNIQAHRIGWQEDPTFRGQLKAHFVGWQEDSTVRGQLSSRYRGFVSNQK